MNKDENSFNLKKANRQRGDVVDVESLTPFSWKEHAYERLKALYGVGKILSALESIENAFPEILTLCSSTFPFLTATIIENKGKQVKTIVWNADNAGKEQIDLAIDHAKEAFIYFTNSSLPKSTDLRMTNTSSEVLAGISTTQSTFTNKKNYCVIPLVVDRLPAFGILQLEGTLDLTESDLEFVGALSDLISISIDRHYKTKFEYELRQKEAVESSAKLSRSNRHILNLKSERELREKFVSLLTHDLRTPLSAISMNAQLIKRNPQNAESVYLHAIRINESVHRADLMISNLLDANLIRSGEKLPINIEAFDLITLIKQTLNELSVIHSDRFVLNAGDSLKGFWDAKGIRRIIENLCNNAIKYGSPDEKIIVNVFPEAHNAIIEICNKGDIISPEDQKNLFQQYRRGPIKAEIKGWGIGLTLVQGVAEAHGGKVKLKSDKEIGTIFSVILPIDSRLVH